MTAEYYIDTLRIELSSRYSDIKYIQRDFILPDILPFIMLMTDRQTLTVLVSMEHGKSMIRVVDCIM